MQFFILLGLRFLHPDVEIFVLIIEDIKNLNADNILQYQEHVRPKPLIVRHAVAVATGPEPRGNHGHGVQQSRHGYGAEPNNQSVPDHAQHKTNAVQGLRATVHQGDGVST